MEIRACRRSEENSSTYHRYFKEKKNPFFIDSTTIKMAILGKKEIKFFYSWHNFYVASGNAPNR